MGIESSQAAPQSQVQKGFVVGSSGAPHPFVAGVFIYLGLGFWYSFSFSGQLNILEDSGIGKAGVCVGTGCFK